jgi:hypothetical protein
VKRVTLIDGAARGVGTIDRAARGAGRSASGGVGAARGACGVDGAARGASNGARRGAWGGWVIGSYSRRESRSMGGEDPARGNISLSKTA